MSYEVSDFNTEVIEASHDRPVLVDFWAPWCYPCRMLSPSLEKLAGEAAGRWSLVTVNTDEHPDLSMGYQVRGIPAVKLFSDGEVVAEFTGAMPEYAIKDWLDQQIPSDADKSLAEARRLIAEGKVPDAVGLLENLQSEPEARLLLASVIVFRQPEHALELVSSLSPDLPAGAILKGAIETVGGAMAGDSEDNLPDGPGKADYHEAIRLLKVGNPKGAIEALMQVLVKDRYYGDDAARQLGVAVFTLLGDSHPVSRDLRRTFDMYLF